GRAAEGVYGEGVNLVRPYREDELPIDPQRLARGLALIEYTVRGDPTSCRALWFLGLGYRRAGSYRRSLHVLERAYSLAPTESPVVEAYHEACLLCGRIDEALVLARRQVELSPGRAGVRSNLALTLLLGG